MNNEHTIRKQPYKVILFGTGGFGRDWWAAIDAFDLNVVGLVDKDEQVLNFAAQHFGVSPENCFSGAQSSWTNIDADFVIDSSPAVYHRATARIALEAGLDMLVVKPMALTLEDANLMAQQSRKHGRKLMVAHQKRFLPGFLSLRDLMMEGELGKPGIVQIDLSIDGTGWKPGLAWRREMPYPLLLDGSIHHFDLIRWVFGRDPVAVIADSFNPPWSPFKGDACLAALLEMSEDLHVNYRATWAPRRPDVIDFFSGWSIEFEHGYLQLQGGEVYLNGRCLHVRPASGNPSLSDLNVEVMRRFVHYLQQGGIPPLSAEDNLQSIAMMAACQESIKSGNKMYIMNTAEQGVLLYGESAPSHKRVHHTSLVV